MKDFFKNQQGLILVLLLGGATLALGYFAFFPLLHKVTALKNELEENRIKQDIKKQRLEDLPKMRQQDAKISNQIGRTDILLNNEQAVVLIERLEKIAQEANNEISIAIIDKANLPKEKASSVKKEKVVKLTDFLPSKDYLELQISLSGDYAGLVKFMHSLETFEYYCDVTGIKVGHQNEKTITSPTYANAPTPGGDVLNPFSKTSPVQVAPEGSVQAVNNKKLNTVLGVVFYTNKQ